MIGANGESTFNHGINSAIGLCRSIFFIGELEDGNRHKRFAHRADLE